MTDKILVDVIHPNGGIIKRHEWTFGNYGDVSRRQDDVCEWYNRQGYSVRYLCYRGDSIEDKGLAPSFVDIAPELDYFKDDNHER